MEPIGSTFRSGWSAFLADLETRRAELLVAAGLDPSELTADYPWLRLADALSLAVCCRDRAVLASGRLRARWSERGLEIEPFPLAAW